MTPNDPYLTYYFSGFKFEFGPKNELFIIDERYYLKIKYRVQFNDNDTDYPFTIIIEEKYNE